MPPHNGKLNDNSIIKNRTIKNPVIIKKETNDQKEPVNMANKSKGTNITKKTTNIVRKASVIKVIQRTDTYKVKTSVIKQKPEKVSCE